MTHERREPENEQLRLMYQLRDDMRAIKQTLNGPEGQPELGFVKQTNTRLEKHGTRIGSLESWRTLLIGAGIVIAAILGWMFYVAIPAVAQMRH